MPKKSPRDGSTHWGIEQNRQTQLFKICTLVLEYKYCVLIIKISALTGQSQSRMAAEAEVWKEPEVFLLAFAYDGMRIRLQSCREVGICSSAESKKQT